MLFVRARLSRYSHATLNRFREKKNPTALQSKPRLLEGCYSVCDIQGSDEKISGGEL